MNKTMEIKVVLGKGDPIEAECTFETLSVFPQVRKELDLTKERKRKKYLHVPYVTVHATLRIVPKKPIFDPSCHSWVFMDNNKMQWVVGFDREGVVFISTGNLQKEFSSNITELGLIYKPYEERSWHARHNQMHR